MQQIRVVDNGIDVEIYENAREEAGNSSQYHTAHRSTSLIDNPMLKYHWTVYDRCTDQKIRNEPIRKLETEVQKHLDFKNELIRVYVNASTYGTEDNIHEDEVDVEKGCTVIVYLNWGWHPEWCGQTLFYDRNVKEFKDLDIQYSVLPKVNRMVIFDKTILHSASPLSRRFFDVRYACVFKYEDVS